MFEHCASLQECEEILANTISQVQLLCEVPLSDSDLSFLTQEIGTLIRNDVPGGTRQLRNGYPVCFACFLTAMGRFYEKDLGYWPIIEEKVGLLDTNWQVRWGQFFIKFLEKYNFEKFDQESGLTYLTFV